MSPLARGITDSNSGSSNHMSVWKFYLYKIPAGTRGAPSSPADPLLKVYHLLITSRHPSVQAPFGGRIPWMVPNRSCFQGPSHLSHIPVRVSWSAGTSTWTSRLCVNVSFALDSVNKREKVDVDIPVSSDLCPVSIGGK